MGTTQANFVILLSKYMLSMSVMMRDVVYEMRYTSVRET